MEKSVGAFHGKDFAIKKLCQQEDIVVEVDLDDELVGTQVFKVVNAVYQSDKDIEVAYSNYIITDSKSLLSWKGNNQELTR